jgi:2-oxo-4-hydroxy-4-carboxy-5-ureidoimidazoline decarboxylase
MTITEFDQLAEEKKKLLLEQCCGSSAWTNKMLDSLPVGNLLELLDLAEEKWYECNRKDWLEAFEHHPMIGDINSLKKKYASTLTWATQEQSGVNSATEEILQELAETNKAYKNKFGYIFIVCASGKSAEQMLQLITLRITNDTETEIKIAMEEQNKITKLRLEKLFAV